MNTLSRSLRIATDNSKLNQSSGYLRKTGLDTFGHLQYLTRRRIHQEPPPDGHFLLVPELLILVLLNPILHLQHERAKAKTQRLGAMSK